MSKNFRYVKGAEFPYQYRYEHLAVTTDCIIFTYEDRQLKVLLVRRGGEPYKGCWAFPGGFLQLNETAEEGALRELREETGLEAAAIGELGVFSDPDRDPRERVVTIAYYALVKPSKVIGGDDADEAAWFSVNELPDLAFDHKKIFEAAMERLRRDIHFEPIGFDLLDESFTIPDLQHLYEAILGVKFDRRNFQRKILASGILEAADKDKLQTDSTEGLSDKKQLLGEPMFVSESALPISYMAMESAEDEVVSNIRKRRPGRIASLFHLNRDKYDKMKKEGGKTEF